jgi:hypothetical protein
MSDVVDDTIEADVAADGITIDIAPDSAVDVVEDILGPPPTDRAPGARTPISTRCDPMEPMHCFLPWPSSRFTVADETTETGLRLTLANDVLPPEEDVSGLQNANGFSRLSPLVMWAPVDADPDDARAAMRIFVAEPGAEFGSELLLRNVVYAPREFSTRSALVGYTRRPMAAASEHLVIVTTIASPTDPLLPNRETRVALGLDPAATADEQALYAYHAPARQILATQNIDPATVARLWDFTTRSKDEPLEPLRTLAESAREAVDAGAPIIIESATWLDDPDMLGVVRGRIEGLPEGDSTYVAPFRIALPRGEGDYRVVLYGHGAGGNVGDASFDRLIAGRGYAKAGIEVEGWTDDSIQATMGQLITPIPGTTIVAAGMMRAQARIAAIHRALEGPLADMLAAETLADQPNLAAGRRPDISVPVWAGGSLGGVTGMVYSHLDTRVAGGVLNVPGAGFTHWLGGSALYEILAIVLQDRYPEVVDIQLVSAMSQGAWDVVDGAAWADSREVPPIFAIQISIDDPIMPNVGSEMVATSMNALHLGVPIVAIPGVERAEVAVGRSAVTQFIAPGRGANDIHGFTARNTEAARAAQQQFIDLITSLWEGTPTIRVPEACLTLEVPGRCDFSAIGSR